MDEGRRAVGTEEAAHWVVNLPVSRHPGGCADVWEGGWGGAWRGRAPGGLHPCTSLYFRVCPCRGPGGAGAGAAASAACVRFQRDAARVAGDEGAGGS